MTPIEELFKDTRRLVQDPQTADDYLTGVLGPAYAAYRKEWRDVGAGMKRDFPLQLDFQLNNRCNFRCPMCFWAEPESLGDWSDPESEFPFDKFQKIVADGVKRGLKVINFEGLNEPLMKKDIHKYIRFAKDAGVVDLTLHSNGLLLSRERSEELIASGLTKLMISLDAFSAETFKITRSSPRYMKVLENIAAFMKAREERGAKTPLLRTSFVVQPANKHEREAFDAFWSKRADWVQIQELMDMTNIVENKADYVGTTGPKVCPQPFYRMSVKTNGDVFPCCCSLGHKFLAKGNVDGQSVSELWSSEHFQNIRKLHAEGRYREIEACRICLDNVYS